jgi:hypothetical protein
MTLFSFLGKKKAAPCDEDVIVDQLIQLYAGDFSAEKKMLDYIERQAKTEQEKQEMIASLASFDKRLSNDSMFNDFKKLLFGVKRSSCMLTHLELSVSYLICTNKYYPEVIIDMLWIGKEQLRQAVESFEEKMAAYGYKLPAGYKAMQPEVWAFIRSDKQ